MAPVTKQAKIVTVSESSELVMRDESGAEVGRVPTVTMNVVLGEATPGEQRVGFMILEADYDALGRPGIGSAIEVTLSPVAAEARRSRAKS